MRSHSIKNDDDHKGNLYLHNHLRYALCVSEHNSRCEENKIKTLL